MKDQEVATKRCNKGYNKYPDISWSFGFLLSRCDSPRLSGMYGRMKIIPIPPEISYTFSKLTRLVDIGMGYRKKVDFLSLLLMKAKTSKKNMFMIC